jgi:hypothetical protein
MAGLQFEGYVEERNLHELFYRNGAVSSEDSAISPAPVASEITLLLTAVMKTRRV